MSCTHTATAAGVAGVPGEGKPCATPAQQPSSWDRLLRGDVMGTEGSSEGHCDGHRSGTVPGAVGVHSSIAAVNTGSVH